MDAPQPQPPRQGRAPPRGRRRARPAAARLLLAGLAAATAAGGARALEPLAASGAAGAGAAFHVVAREDMLPLLARLEPPTQARLTTSWGPSPAHAAPLDLKGVPEPGGCWAALASIDLDGDGWEELLAVQADGGPGCNASSALAGPPQLLAIQLSDDTADVIASLPLATTVGWVGVAAVAAADGGDGPAAVLVGNLAGGAGVNVTRVGWKDKGFTGGQTTVQEVEEGYEAAAAATLAEPASGETYVVVTKVPTAPPPLLPPPSDEERRGPPGFCPVVALSALSALAAKPQVSQAVCLNATTGAGEAGLAVAAVGDFYGDGVQNVGLVASLAEGTWAVPLRLNAAASALEVPDWLKLDDYPWTWAGSGPWLTNPDGAAWDQLLGLRAITEPTAWDVDVVIYGSPLYLAARKRSVVGTRGQYAHHVAPIEDLLDQIANTSTNVYSPIVCGKGHSHRGIAYTEFVELLEATKNTTVNGEPLRMHATLLPPSEAPKGYCEMPTDSDLTRSTTWRPSAAGARSRSWATSSTRAGRGSLRSSACCTRISSRSTWTTSPTTSSTTRRTRLTSPRRSSPR